MNYEKIGEFISFLRAHAESLGMLVLLMVLGVIKAFLWIMKKMDKAKFIKAFNREKEITRVLKQYQGMLLCDYLRVWQFHNGDSSLAKISFLKVSCTNEVYRQGVPPMMGKYKGIFIAEWLPYLGQLIEDKEVVVKDIDKEGGTTPDIRTFLEDHCIKSVISVPLKKDGMVFGYCSAVYRRAMKFDEVKDHKGMTLWSEIFREMYELRGILQEKMNG